MSSKPSKTSIQKLRGASSTKTTLDAIIPTTPACPAIGKSTGIKVQRMDFCDPQGGKGASDRMATAKNHIRIFISEGNDVTAAQQMKDALLSHGGFKAVRVSAADQLEEISIEQPKIQGTEANIIPT